MANTGRELTTDDIAFLSDLLGDDTLNFSEPAPTVIQVQKYIGAIKGLTKTQERIQQTIKETAQFYNKRAEACENQIGRLKLLIRDQLNEIKLNSLATPSGTAIISHSTKVAWPDDVALLSFCTERYPQFVKTKTIQSVDKTGLKKELATSGEILPGYSEEEVIDLRIRG